MKRIYHIICIIFFANVIHLTCNAQVSAHFSSATSEGCSPLQVNFQNESTGTDLEYIWYFGNGNTSILENPTIIYENVGSYNITLIVTDGITTDTLVKENYITVHEKPSPSFETTFPPSACTPMVCTFSNTTIGDTTGMSWLWDFGDGAIDSVPEPIHVYNFGGTFKPFLFAKNKYGCVGFVESGSEITINNPIADFSVDKNYSCNGELQTTFTNASIGEVLQYTWNFGDGNSSVEKDPAHIFYDGKYDIALTIIDKNNCRDTVVIPKLIEVTTTSGNFSISDEILCKGQKDTLVDLTVLKDSSTWYIDNMIYKNKNTILHSFTESGNHTVSLKIYKNACTDSISKTIWVDDVAARFSVDDSIICEFPKEITYTNESVNSSKYLWTFSDGDTSTLKNPTHILEKPNKHTDDSKNYINDVLIVTSINNCSDTVTYNNILFSHTPLVDFAPSNRVNASQLSGCIPHLVDFENRSTYTSGYDSIVSMKWFIDNNLQTGANAFSKTFTNPGTFKTELVVTTALGCVQSKTGDIRTGLEQIADFDFIAPDKICSSNDTVVFINKSSDTTLIDSYRWSFSDKFVSKDKDPVRATFFDKDSISVTLTVNDNGCETMITKENLFFIDGPIAQLVEKHNCENIFEKQFVIETENIDSIMWHFGDGDIGDFADTALHTYPSIGEYELKIEMFQANTGCFGEIVRNIQVIDPIADFELSQDKVCVNETIAIAAKATDYYSFFYDKKSAYYLWSVLPDSSEAFVITNTYNYTPTTNGIHHIQLLIKDKYGCADSISKNIQVYSFTPEFSTEHIGGCMPTNYAFTNTSTSDTTITNWLWSFGDGSTSTEINPTHAYNLFNNFTVSLSATDTLGCSYTTTKEDFINIREPSPQFTVDDSTICVLDSVLFTNESSGNIIQYEWSFSNGEYSILKDPVIQFTNPGYFDVLLRIVDNHGCDTSIGAIQKIHVQAYPTPNFIVDNSYSSCYPFITRFLDKSISNDITSWQWDFDDLESKSVIPNPAHIYKKPGLYSPQLTISTNYGCKDSIRMQELIEISGPYAEITVPDTVCEYEEIVFTLQNAVNLHEQLWSFGDGSTSPLTTINHHYNITGKTYLTVLLTSDTLKTCDKAISDSIYIEELHSDFIADTIAACVPATISFNDISTKASYYHWNFGNGNTGSGKQTSCYYDQSGEYTVQLISESERMCTDTSTLNISIHPLPVIQIANDTIICKGDQVQLYAYGGKYYHWQPEAYIENAHLSEIQASPDTSSLFIAQVIDSNNCVSFDSVSISVQHIPVINNADTTIIIGEQPILNVYDGANGSYNWQTHSDLSCSDCYNPRVRPLDTTIYYVEVQDTSNCFTKEYLVTVNVMQKYTANLPDAFTPNGDGINDVVYVKGWGIKELVMLRIINRFGEVVFQSDDIDTGWDGSYKNEILYNESFMYTLKVKTFNDEYLVSTGSIKIIR